MPDVSPGTHGPLSAGSDHGDYWGPGGLFCKRLRDGELSAGRLIADTVVCDAWFASMNIGARAYSCYDMYACTRRLVHTEVCRRTYACINACMCL